jgi:nucleoside 2-deoxyribosyltransferase
MSPVHGAERGAARSIIETEPSKQAGIQISAKGWEYLHPPSAGGIRGVCFVAMSFDHSLNEVYEDGIRKALEIDCGYTALRVDRVHHNDVITDRIVAGIREAQFVVADFTLHRPAVYYEAGFAKGLGREVVRTCRDTDFDKLCFDTRQFMHIKWTEAADLRSALSAHIKGTLGTFRQCQRPYVVGSLCQYLDTLRNGRNAEGWAAQMMAAIYARESTD